MTTSRETGKPQQPHPLGPIGPLWCVWPPYGPQSCRLWPLWPILPSVINLERPRGHATKRVPTLSHERLVRQPPSGRRQLARLCTRATGHRASRLVAPSRAEGEARHVLVQESRGRDMREQAIKQAGRGNAQRWQTIYETASRCCVFAHRKYTFHEQIGNALARNGAASPLPRGKLGARRKSFTDPACRRRLDRAGGRVVTQALADGRLTVTDLRNGVPVTRGLVGRGEAVNSRA